MHRIYGIVFLWMILSGYALPGGAVCGEIELVTPVLFFNENILKSLGKYRDTKRFFSNYPLVNESGQYLAIININSEFTKKLEIYDLRKFSKGQQARSLGLFCQSEEIKEDQGYFKPPQISEEVCSQSSFCWGKDDSYLVGMLYNGVEKIYIGHPGNKSPVRTIEFQKDFRVEYPVWDWNGRGILYSVNGQICHQSPGGEKTEITSIKDGIRDYYPVPYIDQESGWLKKKMVAFSRDNPKAGIFSAEFKGDNPSTVLIDWPDSSERMPRFSKDGRYMAFSSNKSIKNFKRYHLYCLKVGAKTDNLTPVVRDAFVNFEDTNYRYPFYTWVGSSLFFTATGDSKYSRTIFRADMDKKGRLTKYELPETFSYGIKGTLTPGEIKLLNIKQMYPYKINEKIHFAVSVYCRQGANSYEYDRIFIFREK
jgi:hypothetical protein